MSGFALRYPFFIIMLCLVIAVVGVTMMARMSVDLFPDINIPVVVVATFYNGMPPEQIEAHITNPFERFFTLASGVDGMLLRVYTGHSSASMTEHYSRQVAGFVRQVREAGWKPGEFMLRQSGETKGIGGLLAIKGEDHAVAST